MKRILFFLVACIMVAGFLSVSDVLAVDLTKLPNTEWSMEGIATKYNADGYGGSGIISQGIVLFEDAATGAIAIHNVASDGLITILGGMFEPYCLTLLGPYTINADLNRIKSTSCELSCYDDELNLKIGPYSGACVAKINFATETADFAGTISLTDFFGTGLPWVFTITGKKLGRYPSTTSPAEILRGKIPDSLNNFLKK